MKYRIVLIVLCLIVILISIGICLKGLGEENIEVTVNPHEGQVYIYDGYDFIWYTPIEGVEVNALSKDDFSWQNETPVYVGKDFDVMKGFDVSEFQFDIDWTQIASQGFDFAYVRMGRRGSTEGGLYEDSYFVKNYNGARSCNLDVGVYFFSQAVSVEEAIEEANWVISKVRDSGYSVDLPICYDWEEQKTEDSRTFNLDGKIVTDCAVAFCDTVKAAGYEAAVYYNRIPGYYTFDVSRIQNYVNWFALPCTPPDVTFPSFYYHIDMWQYSTTAIIPGITVETDLDYIFKPKQKVTSYVVVENDNGMTTAYSNPETAAQQ